MKKLGLIDGDRWKLTSRSIVPVDRDDIANGFSGQENPAWESLLGWTQEELENRPVWELIDPADHERARLQGERDYPWLIGGA